MKRPQRAFTIVELLVVITVIVILTTITVFAFGSWRTRTATTEVKATLASISSAMENAKNFSNGYPTSIPSTAQISPYVTATYKSGSTSAYCVDGVSTSVSTVKMFVSDTYTTPQAGSCP